MTSAVPKIKPTLLIADNEDSVVDTVSAVLSIRGFSVLKAGSAKKVREVLRGKSAPDVIVLDILLPGINGVDLCKQLKSDAKWKDIPVLIITGITRGSGLADGFWRIGAGADDFISKPFDPFYLADRVEQLMARSQHQRSQTH